MAFIKKAFNHISSKKIKKKNIQFGKPNFENEWSEIAPTEKGHYDDFKALGKTKWIALANKGKMVRYTIVQAKKIENTDAGIANAFSKLLPIKQKRALNQIDSGKVELSIVANYSDGFKILVAGNTRLTAMMKKFKEGWVWQFDVPDDVADLATSHTASVTNLSAAELTAMQERGSAWIMRRAIKDNKTYTEVDSILKDPKYKELKEIYPVIDDSWINTFFLQQKKMLTEFSQVKFKEFNRDEGFMAFITNLIREKFGISQKDNWNPADIWLIENSNKVEKLIEKHLSGKAQTIIELNLLMQKLYKERKVVGISLKKISGKTARYEEVNISRLTPRFKKEMYNFDITQIKMALDIARKKFSSQDTRIFLTGKGSDTVYNFQIKGNTSSTYANLKWEPTMKGAAAARLGKAPVAMVMDLLESHRFDYVNDHYKYPRTKLEFQKEEKKWLALFKKISKKVDTGIIEKDFIKNLATVFGTREKHIASSKLMQLRFLSELLKLTKDAQNELMTDIAFIAQKKGKAFGPFGKLY